MPPPGSYIRVTVGTSRRKGARRRAIRGAERETKVSVTGWPIPVGVVEYKVVSSDCFDKQLPATAWSRRLCETVQSTLRTGRRKGRVLYAVDEKTGAVVAVLAYHFQSNAELHVRAAEAANAVKESEKPLVAALLVCAEGILRKCPGNAPRRLVWLASRAEASRVKESYRFTEAGQEGGKVRLERTVRP
jgi:hypothetical protein